MALIEELRSRIRFGEQGHSAIVDQFGHVVAHPNAEWMQSMHDLSKLSIVKEMMTGKSGVTEFYSPFIKENMVAGYAAVPGIGWGIMVPQPKSEVEANVYALLYAEFGWGLLGLGFALVISIALARWITRPINHLAHAAIKLNQTGFKGHLPLDHACRMPREVRTLGVAIDSLVRGLQTSNDKIEQLNQSLQHRVEEATLELRQTNQRLAEVARSDYLTTLANRRHFEDSLAKNLSHRRADDESLCLIFIDVDHFKTINDTYGHAAGDAVLRELAAILQHRTRDNDMVARYAGDEFIIKMHCAQEIGYQRATAIMQDIQQHEIQWEGQRLRVSVSMGLLSHHAGQDEDIETLMQRLDKALYEAKQSGRNRLVVYES
jgi:diguanylate cyclase (GGDEF)-like protein